MVKKSQGNQRSSCDKSGVRNSSLSESPPRPCHRLQAKSIVINSVRAPSQRSIITGVNRPATPRPAPRTSCNQETCFSMRKATLSLPINLYDSNYRVGSECDHLSQPVSDREFPPGAGAKGPGPIEYSHVFRPYTVWRWIPGNTQVHPSHRLAAHPRGSA